MNQSTDKDQLLRFQQRLDRCANKAVDQKLKELRLQNLDDSQQDARKACKALNGYFPEHWCVHFIDGSRKNLSPGNLIALPPDLLDFIYRRYPANLMPDREQILEEFYNFVCRPNCNMGPKQTRKQKQRQRAREAKTGEQHDAKRRDHSAQVQAFVANNPDKVKKIEAGKVIRRPKG